MRIALVLSTLFTAAVLGVVYYMIDGIPRNHDRYGRIELGPRAGAIPTDVGDVIKPGQNPADAFKDLQREIEAKNSNRSAKLALPEGEVRLNWEGTITRFGNSRRVDDPPDDMKATVTPAAGGGALKVEDAGGYDSIVGDTGWSSWKKIDVPSEGAYTVSVTNADTIGTIAVGESFWKPGGSRVLGAILAAMVPIVLAGMIAALLMAWRGRRQSSARVLPPGTG